jgi:hypothetical protein
VASEQNKGLIDGTVVNEEGKAVKGATVTGFPTDRGISGKVPHAYTVETGHFAIRDLWWGEYAVSGMKEDEDYPDVSGAFYSDQIQPRIRLTAEHPTATVTIRLGPKAGVLVGTVTDAVTGAPLNPYVEFRRTYQPDCFLRGAGLVNAKHRVLVPSDTDVTMKVRLESYRDWYYPGTGDKFVSGSLPLEPGQERTLNIQLQPRDATAK